MMQASPPNHPRLLGVCLAAAVLLAGPTAVAQSSAPSGLVEDAPRSWLGIDLAKPDPIVSRQLPALPAGVGFVVRSVDGDGPAGKAGVRAYDIVWKFNDQWLINEGQLAALLRLSPPGSKVVLSAFRSGKAVDFPLVLGDAAGRDGAVSDDIMHGVLLQTEPATPVRLIRMEERSAFYQEGGDHLEVRKTPDGYWFRISDGAGVVKHEGSLAENGAAESVPEHWRQRVGMLCRGLDHELGQTLVPRVPRARVLPPKPPVKPEVAGPSVPGAGPR